MATNLLLTGPPGCGKTTLVRRIIDEIRNVRVAGFYTRELRDSGERRVGFTAIGLNGGSTTLASVHSGSSKRVGKYGVELHGFEELIRDEFERPGESIDLFVVDEIGKMECFSNLFVSLTRQLLDGVKPVLATVARKGDSFIRHVKERDDIEMFEVTPGNREGLVGAIAQKLKKY